MNSLTVCAGGLTVSIDAKLLGSVRTLYEGDKTYGTAKMSTEATFLASLPEQDRAAAYRLYQDCVKRLLQSQQYQIDRETLSFRFWLALPTDLRISISDSGSNLEELLIAGRFFDALLKQASIYYTLMRHSCSWQNVSAFNNDHDFFFRHGRQAELYPDQISMSSRLLGQHFAAGKYAFDGKDWTSESITFKNVPDPANQLSSIESLVGKCLYLTIYVGNDYSSAVSTATRQMLNRYGGDTFKSIELSLFILKLSNNLGVQPTSDKLVKVFQSGSMAIWQVDLPKDVGGFKLF